MCRCPLGKYLTSHSSSPASLWPLQGPARSTSGLPSCARDNWGWRLAHWRGSKRASSASRWNGGPAATAPRQASALGGSRSGRRPSHSAAVPSRPPQWPAAASALPAGPLRIERLPGRTPRPPRYEGAGAARASNSVVVRALYAGPSGPGVGIAQDCQNVEQVLGGNTLPQIEHVAIRLIAGDPPRRYPVCPGLFQHLLSQFALGAKANLLGRLARGPPRRILTPIPRGGRGAGPEFRRRAARPRRGTHGRPLSTNNARSYPVWRTAAV